MTPHFRSIIKPKQVRQRVDWCSNLCNSVCSKRGFGIIEVLVASAIIIMVIGATVFLSRMALHSSIISSERTQAYNLAREGIEFVRSLRDTRWINQAQPVDKWNDDIKLSGQSEKYYLIDLDNKELDSTTSDNYESVDLSVDEAGEDTSGKDVYKRIVRVEEVDNGINTEVSSHLDGRITYNNSDDQVMEKVTVIIKWNSHSGGNEVTTELSTYLSNWKPGL